MGKTAASAIILELLLPWCERRFAALAIAIAIIIFATAVFAFAQADIDRQCPLDCFRCSLGAEPCCICCSLRCGVAVPAR